MHGLHVQVRLHGRNDGMMKTDIDLRTGFDDLELGTHPPCFADPRAGFNLVALGLVTDGDATAGVRKGVI